MSIRLGEIGDTSDRGALLDRYREVSVEGSHLQPPSRRSRKTLTGTMAYVLVTAVIGLALFASVTPSPLYREYASLWQLTSVSVTLVYATYAVGVLIALVLAGSISDRIGRKPVLMASLSLLAVSTLLYVVASSVAWLFAARGLQGLATGTALGAASAAMLELHPRSDAAAVGITNAVTSAGGIASGILISSILVQSGWEPRVLPYIVLLVLLVVALIGAIFMPEPVKSRQRFKLCPQRPTVPIFGSRPISPSQFGRLVLLVNRRPVLFARSLPLVQFVSIEQRDRVWYRRCRTRGICGDRRPGVWTRGALDQRECWFTCSGRGDDHHCGGGGIDIWPVVSRGVCHRRIRIRPGFPGWTKGTRRCHPAQGPCCRHVCVLRRGVRLAVVACGCRRSRGVPSEDRVDL